MGREGMGMWVLTTSLRPVYFGWVKNSANEEETKRKYFK